MLHCSCGTSRSLLLLSTISAKQRARPASTFTRYRQVIPTEKPRLLVATMEQDIVLVSLDPESDGGAGIRSTVATIPEEHGAAKDKWRFNDCRATPGGQLIAARMHEETMKGGWVYKIPSPVKGPSSWSNPDVLFDSGFLQLPNGLVWDMSKKKAYYNDTTECKIYIFDCDEAGTPDANTRRVLLDLTDDDGEPDGMTIDSDGNLWVALHAGSRVICVDSESGKTLHTVKLPVKSVSACNWGGPDLRTLYITTIADDQEHPEACAGGLFKAEIDGVRGTRPAWPFIC